MSEKRKKIAYIVATGLFCLAVLPGAIGDLLQPQVAIDMMATLGLPVPLLPLLGVWKLLGLVAILIPGKPRLKEWAFAGFAFDLTGAAYLHGPAGDTAGIAPPLVVLAIGAAAYATWRMRESSASVPDGGQ
jgi:hypothetical protein